MQVFTYSSPRFTPYDDERAGVSESLGGGGPWRAPRATGPLAARLTLPGSKSLTNRMTVPASPQSMLVEPSSSAGGVTRRSGP
jgi:3-phosphoshikimate 1-carboxyvinyltransferase